MVVSNIAYPCHVLLYVGACKHMHVRMCNSLHLSYCMNTMLVDALRHLHMCMHVRDLSISLCCLCMQLDIHNMFGTWMASAHC